MNQKTEISEKQKIIAEIFARIWKHWAPAYGISILLSKYPISDEQQDEYVNLLKQAKDHVDIISFQNELTIIIQKIESVKEMESADRSRELAEIRELLRLLDALFL